MGYMGMGMQKWIYTMRPRKPFSMERKGSFTVIPKYKRTFKIQYSNIKTDFFIKTVVIALFSIITVQLLYQWRVYEQNHFKSLKVINESKTNWEFNFLMKSGRERLNQQNVIGAYSEFKLAIAIYPDNIEAKELLIQSAIMTCYNHGKYCEELESIKTD
ncbi:hypothetical protein [Winogradskyella jejuensis]|uniref:Uncharacterized protein n=1 Tax=Winogradskyella jejuensis TaxID=1089305 RepID=A0A1M5TWI0_9FLAO|nr:hypothetical protein [Winogradskyella jejuensis]SHH55079.1 hypothetical protein SAMN05444148_2290 [Winogradskyella jejuensis]